MKKHITLIGAIALNGVYGQGRGTEGKIPWKSAVDLRFFRETTMGHTVVMGRGTWDSIPPKYRPFPGRVNFVVTGNPEFELSIKDFEEGVKVFNSFASAIATAPTNKVFVFGGETVWQDTIIHADELLINKIGIEPAIDDATVFFTGLLHPEKFFKNFVQADEPVVLTEGSTTPTVTAYRFVRVQ